MDAVFGTLWSPRIRSGQLGTVSERVSSPFVVPGQSAANQVRPPASALRCEKQTNKHNTSWRRSFLPHETENKGFAPGGGVPTRTHWSTPMAHEASPALPLYPQCSEGEREGEGRPEGRHLGGANVGRGSPPARPTRGDAVRARPRAPAGPGLGRGSRSATPAPGAARPSRPRLGQADFLVFLFVFFRFPSDQNPLPGRQRPLSSRRSRRRPASPPCSADLPELRPCPRPPLAPSPPSSRPSYRPGEPPEGAAGRQPAQVRTPGRERGTSGCPAGRSGPRRRRGPGEGFVVRAPGRGVRPGCPRLGTARWGRGREHAARRAFPSPGARRVGQARAPGRATYPGPQDGPRKVDPGLHAG